MLKEKYWKRRLSLTQHQYEPSRSTILLWTHHASRAINVRHIHTVGGTLRRVYRCGLASFYYIMFLTKQAKEEREAFWKKDAENDEKLLKIVESSSDALIHVKNALDQNTQAMRELLYRK